VVVGTTEHAGARVAVGNSDGDPLHHNIGGDNDSPVVENGAGSGQDCASGGKENGGSHLEKYSGRLGCDVVFCWWSVC